MGNSSSAKLRSMGLETSGDGKQDVFCIAFVSPFDLEPNDQRLSPVAFCDTLFQSRVTGEAETATIEMLSLSEERMKQNEPGGYLFTMLDEYLTIEANGTLIRPADKGGNHSVVPNLYQKIIEVLLRFKVRGVTFQPENMFRRCDVSCSDDIGNYYQGYELVKENCWSAPYGGELYITVTLGELRMKRFAELRGVFLPTNRFTFAGGKSLMYSQKDEHDLIQSVRCNVAEGVNVPEQFRNWGFVMNTPTRQRLISRFFREPWRLGGCGVPLSEMELSGDVVTKFFPLPDKQTVDSLGEWASWYQNILHPMAQNHRAIMDYFGEEVTLYFYWIKRYTMVLTVPAIFGLLCGFGGVAAPAHKATIYGAYAILCVGWGAFWNMYWLRLESIFEAEYQLQEIQDQATLREKFEGVEVPIGDDDLFSLNFSDPPAFNGKSDGTLMEIKYEWWKRFLVRYGISYPLILLLSSMMVGLMCLNTYYRLENEDEAIQYGCSFIAFVISKVFDITFTAIAHHTSIWENNRTDEEEQFQKVIKKFFHYFLSTYFSLISLLFWPNSESTDAMRIKAMESQMITNCIIMPALQNVIETVMPIFMARFRKNYHITRSYFDAALQTLLWTDEPVPADAAARDYWFEAQKDAMSSMSGDYLEIALQYGYMTMFAVVFPWSAALAVVFNVIEIRVDANKLLHLYQRPLAKPVKSIGAWKMIFVIISGVSVVTNSFIISVMSEALVDTGLEITTKSRYQFFVGFQYMLVIVAALVYIFTPIRPSILSKAAVKQSILLSRHAGSRRVQGKNEPSQMEASTYEEPMLPTAGAPHEFDLL